MNQARRRQFLVATVMFLAAPHVRAQGSALPLIGYLSNGNADANAPLAAAFRKGLAEVGFDDGRNVTIEYHWAEGTVYQLPGIAADLVRRHVAVIVATGGASTWVPAKAATGTIPIVFTGGNDPVKLGLVASLGRPGGNATGVTTSSGDLNAKRLQLLRELVPSATLISVLINNLAAMPGADELMKEFLATARARGQEIQVVSAPSEREFDAAFAQIVRKRSGALLVSPEPFFTSRRKQLVALAEKHAIPACYAFPEFVDTGGLLSYGVNTSEVIRQAGVYAGRILKGAKPSDLPVLQPTVFELAVNSKTAKTLGIKVPQSILVRADRVIE